MHSRKKLCIQMNSEEEIFSRYERNAESFNTITIVMTRENKNENLPTYSTSPVASYLVRAR